MSSEGTPIACPTPSQALSNCISASARKGRRLSHVREADAARRSSLRGTDGLIPIPANAATQAARRRGCGRKTLRRSFLLSTPPSRTALSSSFGTGSMTRSPQFNSTLHLTPRLQIVEAEPHGGEVGRQRAISDPCLRLGSVAFA